MDFIEKPFNEQVLLDAVNRALEIDRESRARRVISQEYKELLNTLSERENEVMNLVVEGKPNKIIADELSLSIKTVEYHRGNVMTKLKVESVAALVKLAINAQK